MNMQTSNSLHAIQMMNKIDLYMWIFKITKTINIHSIKIEYITYNNKILTKYKIQGNKSTCLGYVLQWIKQQYQGMDLTIWSPLKYAKLPL